MIIRRKEKGPRRLIIQTPQVELSWKASITAGPLLEPRNPSQSFAHLLRLGGTLRQF